MDGAKTWQLAEIHRACPPNAYGKHWAWVHWTLRIPLCEPYTLPSVVINRNCFCIALKWGLTVHPTLSADIPPQEVGLAAHGADLLCLYCRQGLWQGS